MKKEVNLKIQFTNRAVYSLVALGLFVICIFGVYAYNSGASPAVMGHSGEEIHVSVNGETKLLNDAFDDLEFSCPSGFTLVESQGYVLGCIQNDEEGSADTGYIAAMNCFEKYGGRLPGIMERYIAFNMFELNDEIDDYEWIDESYYYYQGTYILVAGKSNTPHLSLSPDTKAYRCFIPPN